MSIRGSLSTMPTADLLDWVERKGLTGELVLERGSLTRKFRVARGQVTHASSTDPAEFLGQLLMNAGKLEETTLRDVYQGGATNGMSLGKILLVSGLVSEATIRGVLELKIREGLYDALAWDDGVFTWAPDDRTSASIELSVAVPLRPCLSEGSERAAAWQAVRQVVPGDDTRFFLPDAAWLDKVKPGSPSALLLERARRGMTVREMILDLHSLAFPVYQRLAELVGRGVLSVDRRNEPRAKEEERPSPLALIESARRRARGGDRRGALELARQALQGAPADEELRRAYQEIERKLFAELSHTLLGSFRVPKLILEGEDLQKIELSPEERYLVGRIDGRWDLLSLMRVSPLREVEALLTFQRLAERGVISLG